VEQLEEDGEALGMRPRSGLGFCGTEERLVDLIFLFSGEIVWDSILSCAEGLRRAQQMATG
jgi:hypothetical protein